MGFYSNWSRKVASEEAAKAIPNEQILLRMGSRVLDMTMNDGTGRLVSKQASDRIKNLDLIFKAMDRIAAHGKFFLTHEQSVVVRAMIRSRVPSIMGDQLVAHIGLLMKKYKMTNFRKVIAARFGRRRGKSKAVGYFHAIMLATQPEFHGMIINLDQDLATQNLKYASEFVKILETDPECVIRCKIKHQNKNELIVQSHHGTENRILSTPNIEASQGKVSMGLFFYFTVTPFPCLYLSIYLFIYMYIQKFVAITRDFSYGSRKNLGLPLIPIYLFCFFK